MAAPNSSPAADPWSLFAEVYERARKAPEIQYPAAMILSTVDPEGWPEARVVLLHELHPQGGTEEEGGGFVFATDTRSPKARALESEPRAALTFYWPRPLEAQVRIQGIVSPASDEVADRTFAERPARSRVTAWASTQSAEVAHRDALETLYDKAGKDLAWMEPLDRPPHWRAYRLVPRRFEFWAARSRRLHDRLLFTRSADGGWCRRRLQP